VRPPTRGPAPPIASTAEALEAERRAAWLIEQRRAAPDQGETAVRRAQLEGERAAERRAVERIERERSAREHRLAVLEVQARDDGELRPAAARLGDALEALGGALEGVLVAFEEDLRADSAAGEALAAPCANAPARRAGCRPGCASLPTP